MSLCILLCFYWYPRTIGTINHLSGIENTLDADVEGVEFEVLLGLDEDSALDGGAGVVEWFLGLDEDVEVFAGGAGISHLYILF